MIFVLLFLIISIFLIVYGIVNKRYPNRSYLFFVGCFFICILISVLIAPTIGNVVCLLLGYIGISSEIEDSTILCMIITIVLMYVCYKLFYIILYWESRPFIGTISEIIVIGQSSDLPDCSEIVLKEFRDRILNFNTKQISKKDPCSSEKHLYITLTNMLSRDKYHYSYRDLTDEGKQLLHIRDCCVHYLVEKCAIKENDKEKYLKLTDDYYEQSKLIRYLISSSNS